MIIKFPLEFTFKKNAMTGRCGEIRIIQWFLELSNILKKSKISNLKKFWKKIEKSRISPKNRLIKFENKFVSETLIVWVQKCQKKSEIWNKDEKRKSQESLIILF